jgi:hypothetical protein
VLSSPYSFQLLRKGGVRSCGAPTPGQFCDSIKKITTVHDHLSTTPPVKSPLLYRPLDAFSCYYFLVFLLTDTSHTHPGRIHRVHQRDIIYYISAFASLQIFHHSQSHPHEVIFESCALYRERRFLWYRDDR